VAIIGAGPAGLLLGHLLRAEGVDCVVVERQTPDHVVGRIRAGVLERVTVGLMERLGLDARLKAEGLPHDGFNLADGERLIRIDIAGLTGQQVVVYGQTEITRDLMDAAPERGLTILYEATDVALHDVEGDRPHVTFRKNGVAHRVDADFIVGCDGFHGASRKAIPAGAGREYERVYPFGWLGITNAALRSPRCAAPRAAATMSTLRSTRRSRIGRTSASGMSWRYGSAPTRPPG
jgi:p-hydroxybenzoate 3-monooxygenase